MSRRSQDIPIRPRYGIPELINQPDEEDQTIASTDRNQMDELNKIRTRKTSSSAMEASSYTEIPFLAQYPDMEPQQRIRGQQEDAASSLVVEEDEDDNTNSKDSSCEEESKTPRRPHSLHCDTSFPYELEGASSTDGQMRHFVAENLEEKLRSDQLSYASHNSTPSNACGGGLLTRHYLQTQRPQIDANVLDDIEIEAQYLATSVDNLNENLCNLLHSISSITADNVEVHKNAVNKLTDSMDANIKCMYTIMAKTEEISKSMGPTEQLGRRIREIKRLVDMLDQTM